MNNTEYDLLTKEKLLKMYEELSSYIEELEYKIRRLEDDAESYEEIYDEGLAEGKEIGYNEGFEDGYDACQKEINLRLTEIAK